MVARVRTDKVRPSYQNGFARSPDESEQPGLWTGLVGMWLPVLGPTGGRLWDWSRFKHDGTLTAMTPATDWVMDEDQGYVLIFDGATNFVSVGGGNGSLLDITDDMTISIILRMNGDYTATQLICGNLGSGGSNCSYNFEFGRTDNEFSWLQNGSTVDAVSSVALSDDDWHHVVLTRRGVTSSWDLSFYFDGIFDETDNTSANVATTPATTSIGRGGELDALEFNGRIADLRLWTRALSSNEIKEIYDDPLGIVRPRQRVWAIAAAAPAGGPPRGSLKLMGVGR